MFAVNASDLWVNDLHTFGNPGVDDSVADTELPERLQRIRDLLRAREYHSTSIEALISVLNARGLIDARIGLELEGLGREAREAIVRAFPRAQIRDCSNLIRLVRMVKSCEEIERLTRAAEISEIAARESLMLARPGCSIAKLVHHFRMYAAEMDADFDHFAFGVRGLGIGLEPHYTLSEGDLLYVDFGCVFQHYFSDGGTTLSLGEPSRELLKRHSTLCACIDAGLHVLRPGSRSSLVREEMWRVLNECGLHASFPHGHGLGLEIRDYPILVSSNGMRILDDCIDESSDLLLEPDMVINLEAATFMPGVASLHIERSVVVTSEGSRALIPQFRSSPFNPLSGYPS